MPHVPNHSERRLNGDIMSIQPIQRENAQSRYHLENNRPGEAFFSSQSRYPTEYKPVTKTPNKPK